MAFGGMSSDQSADRIDWDDSWRIIVNPTLGRQIIDKGNRQRYLAIRGNPIDSRLAETVRLPCASSARGRDRLADARGPPFDYQN